MTRMTYRQALRQALLEEMMRDERVFLMGQDIAVEGGMWEVTKGLLDLVGPDRILDTPISETAILGAALGAAMAGLRPIVEIMYNDFLPAGMDQLVNQIAKSRYMFGGQISVPMVIRAPCGYGFGLAAAHSQSLEAWFAHLPGLYVVMPATPASAKSLLKSSIRNGNPIVFIEHCLLYNEEGEVPEDQTFVPPLGKASELRSGRDLTLVAWSLMTSRCMEAADTLDAQGVSAAVIDLQTIAPLDIQTIAKSVRQTGRLAIAQQACERFGVGAEIMAQLAEMVGGMLAPPIRIAGKNIPIPFAEVLEQHAIPSVKDIVDASMRLVKGGAGK